MFLQLVFSSSATVYGQPEKIPCVEDFELKAMNPYGRTKVYMHNICYPKDQIDCTHLSLLGSIRRSLSSITCHFVFCQLFLEEIARDIHKADSDWKIILLRYFNPVGAHESGKLGEDPKGIPNNLLPYIQQVAVGRLDELNVYGHDYPTPDGTAVCVIYSCPSSMLILQYKVIIMLCFNLGCATQYIMQYLTFLNRCRS